MKDNNTNALENLKEILENSKNIYETTVTIGKRAKQIQENRKESFYTELDSIGVSNSEEPSTLNKENWQEALYNKYEKKSNPLIKAIEDIKQKKVTSRFVEEDEEAKSFP